jgi:uncharacterized protein YgbK (DUF1537 family)
VEDRWAKLEEIMRKVIREEMASLNKNKSRLAIVNGRWTGVTEDQMSAWRDAFPAVDIDAELKKMAAWIVSNPMMAPKSQIGRFVNSWLTKSQNQASLRSIPTERDRPTEVKRKLCAYCELVAQGQVGGIWACDGHWQKAMDRDPVPHMRGVVAKPVAGA